MNLKLSVLTLSILATLTFEASAAPLINPSTLAFTTNSPAIITAKISASCLRDDGNINETSTECGDSETILKVANNKILIPAIEKSTQKYGSNEKNYYVTLEVFADNKLVASIKLKGTEYGKKFKFDGQTLNIYQIKAGQFGITHDGSDFLGSEATKKDKAALMARVSIIQPNIKNSLFSLEQGSRNIDAFYTNIPKDDCTMLKDLTVVALPEVVMATLDNKASLEVTVSYIEDTGALRPPSLSTSTALELKASAVEELGSIELKPL